MYTICKDTYLTLAVETDVLRVDFTAIVADIAYPSTDFVVIYSKNNADIAENCKNICTSPKKVVSLHDF
ncbi:MAG: hypothetical protein MJZ79_07730 [Paludibacteraceae bacterium]|nr:hypothetical protein [Paludibacteraceae bacterium]